MPKKSIHLHVDGFLLRYLDTVDVGGINMLAFFNMNSFESMYFVMKWKINYQKDLLQLRTVKQSVLGKKKAFYNYFVISNVF